MWALKFSFNAGKISFGKISKELGVTFTGYPLSTNKTKDKLIVTLAGTINGEESKIKKALNIIEKSRSVSNMEVNGNFILLLINEELSYTPLYQHSLIYLEPVLIDGGIYYYNVASWNRKDLEKLLAFIEKNWNYEVISFRKEKISNVSITSIKPDLTQKQKEAFELAVRDGFYEYPKKTEIKKLAGTLKISSSTFQQHLRIAEKKLSSFYMGVGNRYRAV